MDYNGCYGRQPANNGRCEWRSETWGRFLGPRNLSRSRRRPPWCRSFLCFNLHRDVSRRVVFRYQLSSSPQAPIEPFKNEIPRLFFFFCLQPYLDHWFLFQVCRLAESRDNAIPHRKVTLPDITRQDSAVFWAAGKWVTISSLPCSSTPSTKMCASHKRHVIKMPLRPRNYATHGVTYLYGVVTIFVLPR